MICKPFREVAAGTRQMVHLIYAGSILYNGGVNALWHWVTSHAAAWRN
jgi:hypothetical protein